MATHALALEDRLRLRTSGLNEVRLVARALAKAKALDLLAECGPSARAIRLLRSRPSNAPACWSRSMYACIDSMTVSTARCSRQQAARWHTSSNFTEAYPVMLGTLHDVLCRLQQAASSTPGPLAIVKPQYNHPDAHQRSCCSSTAGTRAALEHTCPSGNAARHVLPQRLGHV